MQWKRFVVLGSLILFSTFLLFLRLDFLSFSVDEFRNVETDRYSLIEIISALQKGNDLHPPLSHWLSHLWMEVFGESEWALRSIWAFSGVLTVVLTYRLGALLGSESAGFLTAVLLSTSPTFLLYTRFVKYYALTMLLAVALFFTFFLFLQRRKRRYLVGYTLLLSAFLYSDYFGPALCVLWQDLFLLKKSLKSHKYEALRQILIAQAIGGVFWLPWLRYALLQTHRVLNMQAADVAYGFFSFSLKIFNVLYSFSLGETLFPWNPAAIIGLVGATGLLARATIALYYKRYNLVLWAGSFSLFSMILLAGLMSSFITGVPFIAFANHILFICPFFLLWLSGGTEELGWVPKSLLFTSLLIAHIVGLVNYYSAREFHNPIYAVPTREIVARLAEESAPEDIIIAAQDIGIQFYAVKTPKLKAVILAPSDEQVVVRMLCAKHPPRVWLFIFGRDRTRKVTPIALKKWLDNHYELVEIRGYVAQDPLYRRIKEMLFHRPAYLHKLTLYIYKRSWEEQ
ncbi:MAG: hypothetical protein DRI61_05315 [Chloroflexi bacterium]|nr:MAG: hypothetical protein DRI61_05315 [Chloroflexota bacterium]